MPAKAEPHATAGRKATAGMPKTIRTGKMFHETTVKEKNLTTLSPVSLIVR
jgi:hypothetical protein